MTGHSTHTVEISGDAGLRNAREVADNLLKALAEHPSVAVDATSATSIDITILQLLVAARKSALASGKSLTLCAPADGVLRQALVKTGFVSADGRPLTPEGTFWTDTGQPRSEAA
jgi:anti-anti-sigma regulatory factor